MSTLVAIDITAEEATMVTADTSGADRIDILNITSVPKSEFELLTSRSDVQDETLEEPEGESAAAPLSESQPDAAVAQVNKVGESRRRVDLEKRLGLEIDRSLAIIPGHKVLYRRLTLPFSEQKKIDQVAPIQLQDAIPFDIDNFIIDNIVLSEQAEGGFDVLSTLSPEEHVSDTLKQMDLLGVDPVLLTTKASAVAALADLAVEESAEPFGILEFSSGRCSLTVFHQDKLCHMREFVADVSNEAPKLPPELLENIQCSIAYAEQQADLKIAALYVLAPALLLKACHESLDVSVKMLDLAPFVRNRTVENIAIDRYAWAIGLFAKELSTKEQIATDKGMELVDLRKGAYAYKPTWGSLWDALRDEFFYIALAFVLAAGAVCTSYYTSHRSLRRVEKEISSIVATANIPEKIPARREVSVLEEKVAEIEEQLRGMGSLTSLSPLDSLQELSVAITKDIDIDIGSINIGFSRLLLRGSVADNPTLGRLEGLLKKRQKRFCKVTVDPKGRVSGSSRVKFTAEIELCE